ncbi:MAG TPA: hypothetical protein VKY51_05810 [Fredinandcohnia sp.]|nr:hypothetical protein [Fredinandcohnia sp.]
MVLYLVQIDVPTQQAEAFSRYQAGHVAKSLAAMGRSAVGMRARVLRDGDVTRFYWFFELPSLSALEAFLTSREREELAAELAEEFPEARVHLSFGELVGGVRRGLRYGEEPGAAFVLDISLPRGEANGLASWYDEEQIPRALAGNGFVRARRFELHGDDQTTRHLVVLDAVDLDAIRAYESENESVLPAPDGHAPDAVVERALWQWMRETPAGD